VASRFGTIFNFLRSKNGVNFIEVCHEIYCMIWIWKLSCSFFLWTNKLNCVSNFWKDHILLIIQNHTSFYKPIIHHWLVKRLFLSIIVYKKMHESFQIQITRKFHGMPQWKFTPFFGLIKLRISPKIDSTDLVF
jgi:hypothetical protein